MTIPAKLEGYDWAEVFKYAAGRSGGGPPFLALPPEDLRKNDPQPTFDREDVAEVLAAADGENEGADWTCAGRLADGRFFIVTAGCDYTGWG